MKKAIFFSSFLLVVSGCIFFLFTSFIHPDNKDSKATNGGLLTFTIRTVTANGTYAPKHVLAIWVEDANGFVKTRKAMANQRKQYLYTWKAASNYNVVDAITGSTLTNHQTHTVTWNCTDLAGNLVPDGDYNVWVEFTDKHAQGPLFSLTFTKGQNPQSISPPDETYFKDIQLDFTPYIAEFTADANEICQGETVIFTDQSIGATSWLWNFGAGASPSIANTNGPHSVTYSTPGNATVSLTINGQVTETKQNYILVKPMPTADFTFSGNEYIIDFNNTSLNATSFIWDFGDGVTSIESNPTHSYTAPGTYSVSLSAVNLNCVDVITHIILVPMVGFTDQFLSYNNTISVFPCPTTGLVSIRFNEQNPKYFSLSVFSATGKLIYSSTNENTKGLEQNINLDLMGNPKGLYFIKIESYNLNTTEKIILF